MPNPRALALAFLVVIASCGIPGCDGKTSPRSVSCKFQYVYDHVTGGGETVLTVDHEPIASDASQSVTRTVSTSTVTTVTVKDDLNTHIPHPDSALLGNIDITGN